MAIICDNDMEIIVKGSSVETIRKMLDNRLFALIKMPVKKNHSSPFSSSVFVGHISDSISRTFAVRIAGTKTVYEDCEYYLTMYNKRGINEESKCWFEKNLKRKELDSVSVTYPTVDKLIECLKDKDLVLITNYKHYGHFESLKNRDFLEYILFLWDDSESKYIPIDDFCDVRIYLTRVNDDTNQENSFHPEDVRNFDVRKRTVGLFENFSKKYFFGDQYFSAEYEAQAKGVQAAYYVTRFHSNHEWDADPVNIINARFSVFILPGTVQPEKAMKLPADKKTKDLVTGAEYMIDSIHFNSDIFYDFTEFEKYIESYFCYIQFD